MIFDGCLIPKVERYISKCGMKFFPKFPDDNGICSLYSIAIDKYLLDLCDHEDNMIVSGDIEDSVIHFPPHTISFDITLEQLQIYELLQ